MAFTSLQRSLVLAVGLFLAVLACAPTQSGAAVLAPGFYPNNTPVIANKDANNQDVIIGTVNWQTDRLLLQETAYKDSIWMMVASTDIVYPKKNDVGYKISCIKVLDQRRDGKNGEVKVKEGGLGANYAKLRFHSQRGHGLNYVVQVYGH